LGHSSADKDVIEFINRSTTYDLTKEIVDQTITIRKAHKIKLPDAIISATAMVNNFTLISRNAKDFKKISKLKFWDPYG
jgi:predicted nucleic acid-binding protein